MEIDGVFAGEFDILKGCVVKCHYPENIQYNESVLSSYMIPDGVHKNEFDISIFRFYLQDMTKVEKIEKFNRMQIKVMIFEYLNQNWVQYQNQNEIMVLQIDHKKGVIYFQPTNVKEQDFRDIKNEFKFQAHKDLQFSLLKSNFFNFFTEDGKSIGINIQSPDFKIEIIQEIYEDLEKYEIKERYFFNVVKNKKDTNYKRGLLTRSIAICGRQQLLYIFEDFIKYFLDKFSELPVSDEEIVIEETKIILKQLFDSLNNLIKTKLNGENLLTIDTQNMFNLNELEIFLQEQSAPEKVSVQHDISIYKRVEITIDNLFYKNFYEASLIDFITIFQEKTMKIYNSLLRGQRVLFIGYDRSIRESIQCVCAAAYLVYPLNLFKNMYPYEHLQDLDFLENDCYIASVSNPIFSTRKEWFDLCCEIQNGQVIKNYQQTQFQIGKFSQEKYNQQQNQNKKTMEEMLDEKITQIDREFINNILYLISNGAVTENEVRKMFYDYTQKFIQNIFNYENDFDLENEDKTLVEAYIKKISFFQKSIYYEQVIRQKDQTRQQFSSLFGEQHYLQFYKSIEVVIEKKILSEVELMQFYTSFLQNITNDEQLNFILRIIVQSKKNFEIIAIGMFSQSEEVMKRCLKCISNLDNPNFKNGKKIIKKLNFMLLYIYQNMKSRVKFQ